MPQRSRTCIKKLLPELDTNFRSSIRRDSNRGTQSQSLTTTTRYLGSGNDRHSPPSSPPALSIIEVQDSSSQRERVQEKKVRNYSTLILRKAGNAQLSTRGSDHLPQAGKRVGASRRIRCMTPAKTEDIARYTDPTNRSTSLCSS